MCIITPFVKTRARANVVVTIIVLRQLKMKIKKIYCLSIKVDLREISGQTRR